MPLALGHEDLPGVPAPENFRHRADECRVRIDVGEFPAGFHEIGLEQYRLSLYLARPQVHRRRPSRTTWDRSAS